MYYFTRRPIGISGTQSPGGRASLPLNRLLPVPPQRPVVATEDVLSGIIADLSHVAELKAGTRLERVRVNGTNLPQIETLSELANHVTRLLGGEEGHDRADMSFTIEGDSAGMPDVRICSDAVIGGLITAIKSGEGLEQVIRDMNPPHNIKILREGGEWCVIWTGDGNFSDRRNALSFALPAKYGVTYVNAAGTEMIVISASEEFTKRALVAELSGDEA